MVSGKVPGRGPNIPVRLVWIISQQMLQGFDEMSRFLSRRVSSQDSGRNDIRSKLLPCSLVESYFHCIDAFIRWD